MQEDKTKDTATQSFEGEDAVETAPVKPQYQIDLFQTARVHTERFVEDFDTKEEAEAFARQQCRDKGIKEDFEISEVTPEPQPEDESLEAVGAREFEKNFGGDPTLANQENSESESENSPEGSDEKTTQENSLPLN